MTDQSQPPEADIPVKPTSASRTTLSHIMTGNDTNLLGTVHGGVIMKLVDDAAGAVAARRLRRTGRDGLDGRDGLPGARPRG